jgi:hypothetical protein
VRSRTSISTSARIDRSTQAAVRSAHHVTPPSLLRHRYVMDPS